MFDVQGQANVDSFFDAVAPWEVGYTKNVFCYLAIWQHGVFIVVQGAIWLNTLKFKAPIEHFASENVRAGYYPLEALGKSYKELISEIASGIVHTPNGDLHFPPGDGGRHSASFTPLHPTALQSQSRVNVLRIGGLQQFAAGESLVLDWELRAARRPYDSLQDLMSDYQLGGIFTDIITVEVIGTAVMAIDGDSSKIEGELATIGVKLAKSLPVDKVAVSYRLFSQGKVVGRNYIESSQFTWVEADESLLGQYNLAVPSAAVLHCYSLYGGVAQTHWYVTDPAYSQNSRRSIYETFDPACGVLSEFLARSNVKGRDARDFEAGVAWLFWMLGFSTAHLGATTRTQDFADIIVTTPRGHLAVVECTTGLLRADNKLPNLVQRAASVRRQLDQSNNRHIRLLPLIATALTREEVKADLEQAERLGVFVLTKEEINQLVVGSAVPSNPETLFENAERRVRDAQESLNLLEKASEQRAN